MIHPKIRAGMAVLASAAVIASLGLTATSANAVTGKTLTVAYNGEPAPNGLDPILYANDQTLLFGSLYDSLFLPNGQGGVKSNLVKSYVLTTDKKNLLLTIRKGIKFTDGTTLTPQVIKNNLDRRLSDPDQKLIAYNSFRATQGNEISNVSVDGDTVQIEFATAQFNAPYLFSQDAGLILCQKALDDANWLKTHACGTGAYRLNKIVSGSSYTVTKKSNYWNSAAYPFAKVVYKIIANDQARANAVATGQVDLARVTQKNLSVLKAKKTGIVAFGGKIYELTWWGGGQNPAFGPQKGTKKWSNLNVRLALSYGTDRKAFVRQLFPGDRATANFIPKGDPGFNSALDTKYAYNPTKARQLLTAEGVTMQSPLEIEVVAAPGSDTAPLVALKTQWAQIGVNLTVTVAGQIGQFYGAVASEAFGPNDVPNQGSLTFLANVTGSVTASYGNLAGTRDATVDAAQAAALASPNATKLKSLNNALVDQAWVMPIKEGYDYLGYNTKSIKKVKSTTGYVWPILSDIKSVN